MNTLEGRRIWSENGTFGLVILEGKQLQVPTRPGHVTGVMAGGVMENPTGRKEPQRPWCLPVINLGYS